MNNVYMQYQPNGPDGITFRWYGGEYIGIGMIEHVPNSSIVGYEFVERDVINVWDHAKGEGLIKELSEFQKTCDEWIKDRDPC